MGHFSDPLQQVDPNLVEKELSEADALLRRAFVQQYMIHRNAYQACLEIGFMQAYAQDWSRIFMNDGYVRRLILEAERYEETPESVKERQIRYRSWMEKQATYYGPGASHGARVTAITQLMRIEGMDAPVKTEAEVHHRGGVMMVPALTNPDDWGKLAATSQEALKQSVKD